MNTRTPRATAALLLLVAAAGCTCDPTNVSKTNGLFVMKPRSLDFGTACLEDTSAMTLALANEGNTSLQLQKIEVTGAAFQIIGYGLPGAGGETSSEITPQAPQEIAPGAQVIVHLGFTPTEANKSYTASLTVVTDGLDDGSSAHKPVQTATLLGRGFGGADGNNARQQFHVTCDEGDGNGEDGNFADCAFLDFGEVLSGKTKDRIVRLENRGCAPVNVNEGLFHLMPGEPDASLALFSFPEGKPPFKLRGGEKQDVKVLFTSPQSDTPPGVRLQFTSDDHGVDRGAGQGVWDLGLFATPVAPALLVTPDILTYFEAQSGVPLAKEIEIRNTGSAPLEIVSVTLEADAGTTDFSLALPGDQSSFTLKPAGDADASRVISATYTSSGAGTDSARVVVKTASETRTVQLLGGTQPVLVVTWTEAPNSGNEQQPPVDWGTTAVAAKDLSRTLILKNTGQATLTITAVSIKDDQGKSFKLGEFALPAQLAPGDTRQLVVTFSDNIHMTNDAAKVAIQSNDAVDATHGGERLVQLQTTNPANLNPVPQMAAIDAQVGREMVLDGSGSWDPENDPLTYKWTLIKPTNSTARIEDPTAARTRVVSDAGAWPDLPSGVGAGNIYVVKLKVTDSFGNWDEIQRQVPVGGR